MYDYEYYAAAALAEAMRTADRFDVIHCHLGASKIPLSVASRTPVVHTLHTAVTVDDEWVLRRYPAVPSWRSAARRSHRSLTSRDDAFYVIHNSCDFDAYDLAEPPGEYLAFLGRMGAHKNPVDRSHRQGGGASGRAGGEASEPGRGRYFAECVYPAYRRMSVQYVGPLDHGQKRKFLGKAAAFLFPASWAEPFAVRNSRRWPAGFRSSRIPMARSRR